jgi:hypothetical protein
VKHANLKQKPGDAIAVGTVVSREYIPFARVWAQSIAEHHPEIPIYVVVTDPPPDGTGMEPEPFVSISPESLGIDNVRELQFKFTRQELVIALKAAVLRWMLGQGYHRAIFLDADIMVLDHLGPLVDFEKRQGIHITPHCLAVPTDARSRAMEKRLLLAGVFNGGCLAVDDTPSAHVFLEWFYERLAALTQHDVGRGYHYDQRWLDLVPCLFDDVIIERDPGLNVAYWNLSERRLEHRTSRYTVQHGQSCRFFHFSGFEPEQPESVTRYDPSLHMESMGAARSLFLDYVDRLHLAGFEKLDYCSDYDCFSNRTPIPDIARRLYREMPVDQRRMYGDPFDTVNDSCFYNWLDSDKSGEGEFAFLRLWMGVWHRRSDVQRQFPDPLGADQEGFLNWTVTSGLPEHRISGEFAPRSSALRQDVSV